MNRDPRWEKVYAWVTPYEAGIIVFYKTKIRSTYRSDHNNLDNSLSFKLVLDQLVASIDDLLDSIDNPVPFWDDKKGDWNC